MNRNSLNSMPFTRVRDFMTAVSTMASSVRVGVPGSQPGLQPGPRQPGPRLQGPISAMGPGGVRTMMQTSHPAQEAAKMVLQEAAKSSGEI